MKTIIDALSSVVLVFSIIIGLVFASMAHWAFYWQHDTMWLPYSLIALGCILIGMGCVKILERRDK